MIDARATKNLVDREAVCAWITEAARLTGMTLLGLQSHLLPGPLDSGPGVSAVAVIAESHLSVHTWPEVGVITMDFYSCRAFDPAPVRDLFFRSFSITEVLSSCALSRWGLDS